MHLTPWGTIGAGQKQNEALVIPIHADWHVGKRRIDGPIGYSVADWEQTWTPQTELIWKLGELLELNLWALAWEWSEPKERELLKRRFSLALSERLGL